MIQLLVMTDGRSIYLEPTLETAKELLDGPISRRIIHDDSGSEEYGRWLNNTYGRDWEIYSTGRRSGFGGAIISAWSLLDETPYVFHLEDDFVMNEPIDLFSMMTVLDNNPHLVQMALRRQPWNDQEKTAGGIVELDPDSFEEKTDGTNTWLEHRKFFTTNPSLYSRNLIIENPWPIGTNSEGRYGISLFQDTNLRSGYWGPKVGQPKCTHIGEHRNGGGY